MEIAYCWSTEINLWVCFALCNFNLFKLFSGSQVGDENYFFFPNLPHNKTKKKVLSAVERAAIPLVIAISRKPCQTTPPRANFNSVN